MDELDLIGGFLYQNLEKEIISTMLLIEKLLFTPFFMVNFGLM
jgi:hypothetical protein